MSDSESYSIPDGFLYTKDHEWIKSEGEEYLIGITDYASKMLNDIVYVNLPKEGDSLKKKEVFGQVESVKTVSDMYMPVTGTVVKTNMKLTQTPELVSNSPYSDGWMLEIKAENYGNESQDLLDANAYREFVTSLKDSA
jgi:glycine cleavage system H protein